MTHVRIKGFKIFNDRYGKQRCYHRATGVSINLTKHPIGSPAFLAECERIQTRNMPQPARKGTLGAVITQYKQHSAFTGLAVRTQSDYNKQFDYLKPLHNVLLAEFDRAAIVQIRDKAEAKHSWHFANYLTRTLSVIFTWSIDRGLCDINPAAGIKPLPRPKDREKANRPWTDKEQRAVFAAAPLKLRVGLALMLYAALRPADALRLPKSAYDGLVIRHRTAKTGQEVVIYALAPLRQIIDNAPPHLATTIAASSLGQPWNKDGFRAEWSRLKERLEKEGVIGTGLTLYGLRHTAATMLAEEGFDSKTVADYLGQATEKMARHYSSRADLDRKMQIVGEKMDAALIGRDNKIVKPARKSVKPE